MPKSTTSWPTCGRWPPPTSRTIRRPGGDTRSPNGSAAFAATARAGAARAAIQGAKDYIPPWDGRDFAELVADEGELREWILGGRPQRFQANPLARFFLDRQTIRMPAFCGQVMEEELRALKAYIGWLRAPVPGSGRSFRQGATEGRLR